MTTAKSNAPAKPLMLETRAHQRFILLTPRKLRRVLDAIRGKKVIEAYQMLRLMPYSAAPIVLKKLIEAIHNAKQQINASPEELIVSLACADEGPRYRRFKPRAQGRVYRRERRTSHLTLAVGKPV
ncbi:MAG: 50S ribosomal protein L22 [Vampirovibrionales bacterium]|nr:50S ribosomal protein L22 [Vampirovibrionales bacterium]